MTINYSFEELLTEFPTLKGLEAWYSVHDWALFHDDNTICINVRPSLMEFSEVKTTDNLSLVLVTGDGELIQGTTSNISILKFCNDHVVTNHLLYVVAIEYFIERTEGIVTEEYFTVTVYL